MTGRRLLPVVGLLWLAVAAGCGSLESAAREQAFDAPLVYLTWQRDPTTTMTVHWLGAEADPDEVRYALRGGDDWSTVSGSHHLLPHTDRVVHTVELAGLRPGADYRFRVAADPTEHAFRTMPDRLDGGITFVSGGDVYKQVLDETIYPVAASYDPMFVLLGGDLAYTNGQPSRVGRWFELLDVWNEHMITSDGRLIPLIVAIGNHEVRGGYGRTREDAPFFYSLFAWPSKGYGVLDFGDYLSIVILDSDHTNPIEGEQADWLEATLIERRDVEHLLVAYHVPAFPSHRSFDGSISQRIREHWVPKFERQGVDVVFEHHDHTYKRTPLIRNMTEDPEGVLYLGDGAWGAHTRSVKDARGTWYLDRAESVNHFIVTTLEPGDRRRHLAVDREGVIFDRYP